MSKKPLITRSALRSRKKQLSDQEESGLFDTENQVAERSQQTFHISRQQSVPTQKITDKQAKKELAQAEKQIDNFYRKEKKKTKPLKKSRSLENQRSRDLNGFLTGAIIVVSLLIVVVMLATFFL
ncbi:cell wall synthase accessory phosphoprotein MacP [Enterococcus diestrammenae]|uniref:cell wall synthase accessory phosphoprotein MacP n=1 Tax=Enterococcus diestrammenae TaxID=1155073 RepID=UPI0022E3983E|nr:cell wall synthase accessory phosphoprotein MacP [Enterococcus diestrammenae]